MRKNILLFVLFLWCVLSMQAQNKKLLDSLQTNYQITHQDSTKILILTNIAAYHITHKIDSAISMAQEALNRSEKMNFERGKNKALHVLGLAYQQKSNYVTALDYFQKSLKNRAENHDKFEMINDINNIAYIYKIQGNYPLALDYYQKNIKLNQEIDNKENLALTNGNIGMIYQSQGNYLRTLEYLQKKLKIKEEIGNKQEISYTLNEIANIYETQDNHIKALEFLQRSLKIKKEMGDKEGIAHNSNEIGTIYKSQGEYQKALEYYQKSYQTNYQIGNKQGLAHVLANFGSVYANKKEYKTALEYYQQTLKMFEQIGDRKQTAITLNNIGNIYTKKGDYTKALEYYKKSLQTVQKQAEADKLLSQAREEKDKQKQDSLKALAEKIQEEANSLTEEGKIRKIQLAKEKEAKEVQQKIIYLILSGLLLMIFFAYFIYLSRQKEKKAKEFISQQKEEIQTTLELVETERAKSDKLLLNILPAETAAELKEVGSATPKHYKLVSVLFTDLKGFTKIAEKLSPQEVIENLNTCFLAFDEICDKYNLEKIKTIGDAYMCAGGLPLENKTNPVDIVLAGLEMQRWMADWKKEKQARGEETWELRLGIHSGEAIAGVVGKNKFAYDIWGDTVNLASRMESSGQVGMVNISETTYNLVKHKFQCKYRGAIHAKNKGEVDMYFVEGVL